MLESRVWKKREREVNGVQKCVRPREKTNGMSASGSFGSVWHVNWRLWGYWLRVGCFWFSVEVRHVRMYGVC